MTGSIQGSAIDDSFETLTNAPDAWLSGRYAAPPPFDYQHYVEPGDTRSAVDDRCFTEYGTVEHTRHVSKTTKPTKTDAKHRRSRQTSIQQPLHGKRRPSPSFRIRSKDGDSVVVSNPFVLRKPPRPQPHLGSGSSSQTDEQSQYSSTTAARSRRFQIRIRGKNGEEAIHEIGRPLHFASHSSDARQSQATTLVGDDLGREDPQYWPTDHSSSSHKRDHRHKSKSGQTIFTDFVVDSSTVVSPTARTPVKMFGALPDSSPAPTTNSSRSRLLPPEKPASCMHDSVMSNSACPSKIPSCVISHQSESSRKNSSSIPSQNEVIIVPDESLDGSVVPPCSSLSTHCIVSSRRVAPITSIEPSEASTTSRIISSRIVTLTQSSKQVQKDQDSPPATVSLSKQKQSKQEAYYNWKVPQDSLYFISTKSSRSSTSRHDPVAPENTTSASTKLPSHHGDSPSRQAEAESDTSPLARSKGQQTLPEGYKPPPRSLSARSARSRKTTDGCVQEIVSAGTQSSGQSRSARCMPLPASHSSSSKPKAMRPSTTSTQRSTNMASQKPSNDIREWIPPPSEAAAIEWTIDKHSEQHDSQQTGPKFDDWREAAEGEGSASSSNRSKLSQTSKSRKIPSHKAVSSGHHVYESLEQGISSQRSWVDEKGPRTSTRSTSPINIEEDLLHYLPELSEDDRLPPPMPMLTTIYEELEPTLSSHPPSMLTQESQVLALCYSAGTGQYLLTGSTDRQIRLFNPATGLEVQKYSAHGYEVHDLSVAQDNDRFISVGGDKTVFLWDVATHQTLRRWSGHAGRVNACAFAGEGDSLVVTGSFDSTVKIWDCKQRNEKPIMTLSEAKDAVSSVSVSGSDILAASVDGRVRCYDVRMGVMDQDVLGHPITSVTPTVNNDSYLASTLDSTLRLMDKRDGKLLQAFRHPEFKNEKYRLRSTLAVGDSLAISGSEDGHIYVWDLLTGNLTHKLKHAAPALTDGSRAFVSMSSKRDVVNSVAWNQLRKEWASAGGDGSVVVWGT
ncbi:hypothetical protein QM012_008472 [Aureobasidium pullulans]|uniref:WD40 repeat-like protein n=1 Tax=Aureobasidium pullulans TaxID=5580 RepID=A0ABR0TL38_AURPU